MQTDARSMSGRATPGVRTRAPVTRAPSCSIEALEPRLFLSRSITGTVFEDLNADGKRQHKEHLLRGVAVFLDLNGNGVADAGEPAAVTNKSGAFVFRKLAAGVYHVVQTPPAGDVPTLPAGGMAVVNLTKKHSAKLTFGDRAAPIVQKAPDTAPPAASLSAVAVGAPTTQPYQFSVLWTDATAVDPASFGDGNVIVSGSGGFSEPALLAALDSATPGLSRTAIYQIATPPGGWTTADNGTYTIVLQGGQVRDTLGNVNSSVSLGTFTVAIDPATPATPVLLPISDTGTSSSDAITSLNNASPARRLKFSVGHTTPGATVTLFADGAPIGTAIAASSTTVIATDGATALTDGPHSITAGQTPPGGLPSPQSSSLTLTVGATPPATALSAGPVTAAGGGSYTFTVTYSDNTAVAVASLDGNDVAVTGPHGFNRAATLVGLDGNTDATSRTATYSIPAPGGAWAASDNGVYTIALKGGQVSDIAGNAAAGKALGTFAVSIGLALSPAPGAPALLPGSDTGASNVDSITALDNSSPAAALQFTVPGTESGATVTLYVDGAAFAAVVSPGGTITLTTPGSALLTPGPHFITARQTIPGSSESADSTPIGIVVDTIAPTASSNPPAVSAAGATNYTFQVVYRDNLSLNVSTFGTGDVAVAGPNGFSVPATFISVNSQTNGMPRTVTYAITPPGGAWSAAASGGYTIQLQPGQAFDTAGNPAAAATIGNFTVNIPLPPSPAPAAPVLAAASDTGASAADGLTRLNNSSPAAALQFSVANTVAGATVTLFADGAPVGSGIAGGTTTLVTTNGSATLADGPHTFTARQTAPVEGPSSDSAGAVITIDTSLPAAIALQADNVTAGGAAAYSFTVTLGDNIALDTASFDNADVVISGPGNFTTPASLVTVDNAVNGAPRTATYQFTPPGGAWSAAGNGVYALTLQPGQIADTAGNLNAVQTLGTFTVAVPAPVSTAPGAPALAAGSDSGVSQSDGITNLNNSSPSMALQFVVPSTTPGATVTVYADGTPIGAAVAAAGSTSTTVTTTGAAPLSDGVHAITARQTSPGDAQSPDSPAAAITIDTTSPAASALNAPDVAAPSAGATSYTFTVTYSDATSINAATLGDHNLVVANSALAFSAAATLVSIDTPSNGSPRTATYQITPPGGSWSASANGTYTISLQPGTVADIAGNSAGASVLGTFTVALP
ncbi:MAG: conserved repeat domain protein [Phycisphaerales bacterium]|nr:conserved repeat domain protein [Phycisphaerales bacterium]